MHGPLPQTPEAARPLAKYGPKVRSLEERFWAKVEKTDGCWLWTGCTNGKLGYGMIYDRDTGRKELAHRVAWKLATGSYPTLPVLHACDNPRCVRYGEKHLFLGTQRDNMDDMAKKGRGRYVAHSGEENGFSKLSEVTVREIRSRWDTGLKGDALQAQLAAEFGVCFSNIGHIVARRTWKHVV